MKPLCILSLCLTSLMLFLYPLVLMANVMSIAAVQSHEPVPLMLTVSKNGFLWISSLYPLPWLAAFLFSLWSLYRKKLRRALLGQLALWSYLLVGFLFFCSWFALG